MTITGSYHYGEAQRLSNLENVPTKLELGSAQVHALLELAHVVGQGLDLVASEIRDLNRTITEQGGSR